MGNVNVGNANASDASVGEETDPAAAAPHPTPTDGGASGPLPEGAAPGAPRATRAGGDAAGAPPPPPTPEGAGAGGGEEVGHGAELNGHRRGSRPRDREAQDLRAALDAARGEAAFAKAEAAAARAAADEYRDKYLRERAALENHKKRVERTLADAARQERSAFLLRLLEVLDNLERALAHDRRHPEAAPAPDTRSLATGLRLTYLQFKELLGREGLAEVPALGQPFDPALHEAVAVDEASARPEGEVVAELQKGYRFGDELLRPARVTVAAGRINTDRQEAPPTAAEAGAGGTSDEHQ
jgi:molecular chaperone GrpE